MDYEPPGVGGGVMSRLRDEFATLVAAGERTDLARAALEIARIGYPTLEPDPWLQRLDALAAAVRPRLVPGASPEAAVAELTGHPFGDCGFHRHPQGDYDPRNSYPEDVPRQRAGLPVSPPPLPIEGGGRVWV